MFWAFCRRVSRRHLARLLLFLFLACNFLDVFRVQHALLPSQAKSPPRAQPGEQKIFIVATHWNNEAIIRDYWSKAIVALAQHFGPRNVYISIYESGSWDDTKGALRLLDADLEVLGVERTLVLDETTHVDEITKPPASTGWIDTPRGKKELRRIPYLSALRNLSLKPLEDLDRKGRQFDKILFLNDVVFTTDDVVNLINTNGGVYSAACALDFSNPPAYYDTFALRDLSGQEPIMQVWPYFGSRGSRSALKSSKPIPVESCWNGMVFMNAMPFYASTSKSIPPLRFRGIPDSLAKYYLEGSECCLIHADNPLTPTQGIWLNPNVRVSYNGPAYETVHPEGRNWLSTSEIFCGLWKNRIVRWWPATWIKSWSKGWVVDRRLRQWKREDVRNSEVGRSCLINEMQVLVGNGWAHV